MTFIIFDFDGTLVDSYSCMVEKFIHLADEFKFRKIDTAHAQSLRDLTSLEIIRYLNIPLYKLPLVIKAARRLSREAMPDLEPVKGLRDVILKLHVNGNKLGIVTSNSKENVEFWLRRQVLLEQFVCIQSESHYFSKHRLLTKVLKKYRVPNTEAWYIGDETRDIEAGKKAGIKTAAVTWGYNSEKALAKMNPDLLVRNPEELINLFKTAL